MKRRRLDFTLRTWGLGLLLVLALAMPLSGSAQSTGDEQGTPVAITSTQDISQSDEPTATEVPPTETPTPEPVATETPTPAPTATDIPPTETPSQAPATETPTAVATGTPTPSPTPSPTPTKGTKTTSLAVAPLAASGCTLISPSNATVSSAGGPYVTYLCTSSDAPFKLISISITSGWEWSANLDMNSPGAWSSSTGTSTNSSGGSDFDIYVFLRPTSTTNPPSTGSFGLTMTHPSRSDIYLDTTLTATYAGMSAANFTLSCTPQTVTVAATGTGTSTCTLSPVDVPSATTVTANSITLAPVAGWTLSASPTTGSFTGATTFTFTVLATPDCSAATNPSTPNVQITTSLTSGSTFAGPSASITAKRDASPTLFASITGSSITWSRTYSFSSQSVSGSLTYQVANSGCSGWNVQMSATNFNYSGSAGGTAIPNGNASVTPGTPSASSGSLAGVAAGGGGALSSAQKVISASASNGLGAYNQTVGIGVTIPGGARVGVYTSTITITAAAGP